MVIQNQKRGLRPFDRRRKKGECVDEPVKSGKVLKARRTRSLELALRSTGAEIARNATSARQLPSNEALLVYFLPPCHLTNTTLPRHMRQNNESDDLQVDSQHGQETFRIVHIGFPIFLDV